MYHGDDADDETERGMSVGMTEPSKGENWMIHHQLKTMGLSREKWRYETAKRGEKWMIGKINNKTQIVKYAPVHSKLTKSTIFKIPKVETGAKGSERYRT